LKQILPLLLLLLFPFLSEAQTKGNQRPADACATGVNNGFETPVIPPASLDFVNASSVPNWATTAPDNIIEIWSSGFQGVPSYEGNQFAELNANFVSTLIKNFTVQAGVPLTLSFAHRGRQGVDVMSVSVGPVGGPFTSLGNFSDDNTAWGFYQIPYTPAVSGPFQLRFISVSAAGGNPSVGNFLDGVNPGSPAVLSIITPPPTISCTNVTLNGSLSTGGTNIVYAWTTTNGTIAGAANANTVSVAAPGTYTLTVTDNVLGCTHASSVTVIANPILADAGPNQSFCGLTTTATLAANNPANNGVWTLVSGAGTVTTPSDPNSGVTGLGVGNNIFQWSIPTGVCASTDQVTIHLDAPVTANFTALPPICSGSPAPTLPATSTNGVTGIWAPATVSNTANGTYTFTPDAGQCAAPVTISQTIIPTVTPTFAAPAALCFGGTAPVLPATSSEGITGSWLPATVSNTATGTYTFTPTAGQCATTTTFTQVVTPNVTPAFNALPAICNGGTAPVLPTTSLEGITGTWSPATVSNTATGTYSFTPAAGQCALSTTITQTVTPNTTPSFAALPVICSGSTAPVLPAASTNGITGTWLPATVSNTATGTYTFTPDAGQCAVTATLTQTITPNTTPTFTALPNICTGSPAPLLSSTSNNGITGTWSPATVSNAVSATYIFTPNAGPCAVPATLTQTIIPPTVPQFAVLPPICSGTIPPVLSNTSLNGITGSWSPSTVSNSSSDVYTFTADPGQCAVGITTLSQTVNPSPFVNAGNDTTVFAVVPFKLHASGGSLYTWTEGSLYLDDVHNPNPTAVITDEQRFTVMVTDLNGCIATDDVLVKVFDGGIYYIPNTFTPNGDGINDVFRAIPAGIKSTEFFNIFNRWGELIFTTKDLRIGWDGTFKGKKQPTDNYIWIIKGKSTAGRDIELKGSIKLIR
jgi:gliding motility-associated-like protein